MTEYSGRVYSVGDYWSAYLVKTTRQLYAPMVKSEMDYPDDLFETRDEAIGWLKRRHTYYTGERGKAEEVAL